MKVIIPQGAEVVAGGALVAIVGLLTIHSVCHLWIVLTLRIKAKAGAFPIISFNHGIDSGGAENRAQYSDIVKIIASWGFFVVAMDGCSTGLCEVGPFSRDQLNVINRFAQGKVSRSKYPFVALADASNVQQNT